MINIAIAVDCPASTEKIIRCLKHDGRFSVALIARNGYEIISSLQTIQLHPDIFILGTKMPIMDGIATSYFLSSQFPLTKILALSENPDLKSIEQAIEAGANGYVIKYEEDKIILNAIETILKGEIYFDSRIKLNENSNIQIQKLKHRQPDTITDNLTPREKMFIMLSATTLTYEQISRVMFVEQKTIETYFNRVSKKLNVSNRHSLTLFALQNGLARLGIFTRKLKPTNTNVANEIELFNA